MNQLIKGTFNFSLKEFVRRQEVWLVNWHLSMELLEYGFLLVSSDSFPNQQETRSCTCTGLSLCHTCNELAPFYGEANELSSVLPDYKQLDKDGCGLFTSPMATGLAYLIHTTGTTGRPKQVWVPHCCVVPNVLDLCERFDLRSEDRVLNAAPLTFDPSVVEVSDKFCQFTSNPNFMK